MRVDLRRIATADRTIALVGADRDDMKLLRAIPADLKSEGDRIVPANPTTRTMLGHGARPSLASLAVQVDIVQVFRPADEPAAIAQDAMAIGAGLPRLQQGPWSADSPTPFEP